MTHAKRLTGILCGIAVAVAIVYWLGHQVPRMESPIVLSEAGALADGGTAWVELQDARGRHIRLEVRGKIANPASFPVYIQPWFPWLPISFEIQAGSQSERDLELLINRAAADNPTAQAHVWALRAISRVIEMRRSSGGNT